MFHLNYLAGELVNLTMLEAKELVRILEQEHGIVHINPFKETLLKPVKFEEEKEQIEFNVFLRKTGGQKLQIIKAIKEITGLGLRDSKDLVDSAPGVIRENVMKTEAETLKLELENLGATVEIR